jgi:membrane-bound lytic murein transglycosylase A
MRFVLVFFLLTLAACVRPVLKNPQDAMREASAPELVDDMSLESLIQGLKDNIQALKNSSATSLTFGKRIIAKPVYLEFLESLLKQAQATPSSKEFLSAIGSQIEFMEVYGSKSWGEVMITSYFEPVIKGSQKQTPKFSQPLYQAPKDILLLSMDQFNLKFENGGARDLRARLVGNRVLPYYSREEIDVQKTLKKRGLEICWVDPIDAFILQIQGSGVIEFSSGRQLRLSYAEKNGHSYESIGKFLMDKIPFEQLNLQTIEAHLRTLPKEELQAVLNKNPSYVFFKPATSHAVTALGVPATAGRTIATDRKYFPKGALGFLVSTKPVFENDTQKWDPLSRFVFDQDIGGAIQGGGRVDLFWGRGEEAKKYAGLMKQPGKLYYIVPKAM